MTSRSPEDSTSRADAPEAAEIPEPDRRARRAARVHGGRGRGALQISMFVLPLAFLAVVSWRHRLVAEDGFIYLRVAKQLVAGHGPVFNPGARVEATTGVLWVYLLAAADVVLPFRLEWIAVGLGILLTVSGVGFAMAGARLLWPDQPRNHLFLPFGAVAFVAVFPTWVFATTGLETGVAFGWLGACLWVLAAWARSDDARLSYPGAVLLGLGWLVRPELVLFSGAFFVLVLVLGGGRSRWKLALAMLAVPVAYQVFRMGYYGSFVPNTAIAKDSTNSNWERGWRYLKDFVGPYWLWIPALAMLLGGYLPFAAAARRRARPIGVASAFVICGALYVLYIVWVGGDHTHARLLLPAFFAACAPVAMIPATRAHLAALILVPWAAVAIVTLRPDQYDTKFALAHGLLMVPQQSFGDVTAADAGWGKGGPQNRWYSGPGYYRYGNIVLPGIKTRLPLRRGTKLPLGAFYGIGVSGYALGPDFRIIDLEGLADPFTAHLVSTLPPLTTFPGHSKPLPPVWLAARVTRPGSHPDPKDFPSFGTPLIPLTTGRAFQEQVLWARAALRCDGIRELLDASEQPLTPGRFVSNLVGSVSNTRTRIPPDPTAAYHKFCGPGVPESVRRLRASR